MVICRFLCSEEDEGFSTEPVTNKQNGGPLGFYYNQKVLELHDSLTTMCLLRRCLLDSSCNCLDCEQSLPIGEVHRARPKKSTKKSGGLCVPGNSGRKAPRSPAEFHAEPFFSLIFLDSRGELRRKGGTARSPINFSFNENLTT